MARRQTYREGPPFTEEYDDIFDPDPAEETPYYNKRYEGHLYQTEQEKAREIFRLLRALNEHLDEQDRKRDRYHKLQLQRRSTGDETATQQKGPTIPPLFVETDQPKDTCTITGEPFSPRQRPTTPKAGQPEDNETTPNEVASKTPQRSHEQNSQTHRNTYPELIPIQTTNDREHTISTEEPEAERATAPRHAKPIDGQQREISVCIAQATDVDHGSEATTTPIAKSMKPPGPPHRMRNPTSEKGEEHYEHTLRDLAMKTNKQSPTPPNSSAHPSEEERETYPYWQPMNANTPNSRTKPIATYDIDRPSPTLNPEEPFTGRDTKVIPDRGKSFKRS